MSNIVNFRDFKNKREVYELPPLFVILALFRAIRGIGTDYYQVIILEAATLRHKTTLPGHLLNDAPSTAINRFKIAEQLTRHTITEAHRLKDRLRFCKIAYYDDPPSGCHVVYALGEDDLLCFAWYDSEHTAQKGGAMASLFAYAFARANLDHADQDLIKRMLSRLLFENRIPLSQRDVDYAIRTAYGELRHTQ